MINDPEWVWWSLPVPSGNTSSFGDLCERDAPCDPPSTTREICGMLAPLHKRKLRDAIAAKGFLVGTAYKRTRPGKEGKNVSVGIRFDGSLAVSEPPRRQQPSNRSWSMRTVRSG